MRFLYLCRPAKNVITLVVTWVVLIGGLWGGRTLEVRPPVRRERHWDIEISRILELLQFCSRRVVVLCCCD